MLQKRSKIRPEINLFDGMDISGEGGGGRAFSDLPDPWIIFVGG